MNQDIISRLTPVTTEEQTFLEGNTSINRDIYMQKSENKINSRKLLEAGKLITIRPHTRFVHFPVHTHDYVEMVYMCQGKTTHLVNGKRLELKQGDLLLLSQRATHEVCKAEEKDIAVNFIVLPDFFTASLSAVGEEETPLRKFLVDCLCGQSDGPGYLYFNVADIPPIQNLIENLLYILLSDTPDKQNTSKMTMALLFLQLTGHTEKLITENHDETALFKILRYIESSYTDGSLAEAARLFHYDVSWLSREIKRKTGKTYTTLLQEKRLAQAAFLLKNTRRTVADISIAVGYENVSYFHRIFTSAFGTSPKHYRDGK